jgi:hypothetical protein
MTTAPTLDGKILGQAERAARAVLDVLLEDNDTTFDQWIALGLVANEPEVTTCSQLVDRFASLIRSTPSAVAPIAEELVERGWVAVDDHDRIEFTAAGASHFGVLAEGAFALATQLYGGLDHGDLLAAARVLIAVKERADAVLAA